MGETGGGHRRDAGGGCRLPARGLLGAGNGRVQGPGVVAGQRPPSTRRAHWERWLCACACACGAPAAGSGHSDLGAWPLAALTAASFAARHASYSCCTCCQLLHQRSCRHTGRDSGSVDPTKASRKAPCCCTRGGEAAAAAAGAEDAAMLRPRLRRLRGCARMLMWADAYAGAWCSCGGWWWGQHPKLLTWMLTSAAAAPLLPRRPFGCSNCRTCIKKRVSMLDYALTLGSTMWPDWLAQTYARASRGQRATCNVPQVDCPSRCLASAFAPTCKRPRICDAGAPMQYLQDTACVVRTIIQRLDNPVAAGQHTAPGPIELDCLRFHSSYKLPCSVLFVDGRGRARKQAQGIYLL